MDEIENVEGMVVAKIFSNDENGYTVAIFQTDTDEFTIVGTMPSECIGRRYKLKGNFKIHKKFGEQFAFVQFEEVLPTTAEGIEAFLASGAIKGIGEAKAKAIVKKFGDDTLRIIEEEPRRLVEVSGIGKKRAEFIHSFLSGHKSFANATMFLQGYGISSAYAMRIFKVYGVNTEKEVTRNPYALAEDVFGIGFKKADEIAKRMGKAEDSEERIIAGINYELWAYSNGGDTFVPKDELCEATANILELSSVLILDILVNMAFSGDVQIELLEGREVVFLMQYYLAEKSVCSRLVNLENSPLKPLSVEIDNLIIDTETQLGIEFSKEQKLALETSVNHGVSVITGGPGTGKTTVINGLINILEKGDLEIGIVAPTGRAAKRITETTGREAKTIHRMLEYFFFETEKKMKFGKHENDKLEVDALIVDEASMIDLMLMDALLRALRPSTRLFIVGDADQLPSIGVGNVLRDIINSEYVCSTKLTEIFRQAKESLIITNAHKINRGEYPSYNEKGKDFFFMERDSEEMSKNLILDLCNKRLPKYYDEIEPISDIQVLTPMRKGPLGCTNLNIELQKTLNPPSDFKDEVEIGNRIFRVGDKVMQMKNNYEMEWKRMSDFTDGSGIFNGDVGFVEDIDKDKNRVGIIYDGDKYVWYENIELDEVELAYAVTVHKSQGSEFPLVIIPMTWAPPMLATRNLLYTAVTRGKEGVVLVGSVKRMEAMVDNNRIKSRYSGLAARLKELI